MLEFLATWIILFLLLTLLVYKLEKPKQAWNRGLTFPPMVAVKNSKTLHILVTNPLSNCSIDRVDIFKIFKDEKSFTFRVGR